MLEALSFVFQTAKASRYLCVRRKAKCEDGMKHMGCLSFVLCTMAKIQKSFDPHPFDYIPIAGVQA